MTIMFIDGDFRMVRGQKALLEMVRGLDEPESTKTALADRIKYHSPGPYASTIGMPIYDDQGRYEGTVCIGCWWCEGIGTTEEYERAKELWTELKLDDPWTYGLARTCEKHPWYTGKRRPRTGCEDCLASYEVVKAGKA